MSTRRLQGGTGPSWDSRTNGRFANPCSASPVRCSSRAGGKKRADAFRDLLRLDRNDRPFARDGIFRGL